MVMGAAGIGIVGDAIIELMMARARNPVLPAMITAELAPLGDTPRVMVIVGGATRPALYPIPSAIEIGGSCFVTRAAPEMDAMLYVVATNYQVPAAPRIYDNVDGYPGYGEGSYGSGGSAGGGENGGGEPGEGDDPYGTGPYGR